MLPPPAIAIFLTLCQETKFRNQRGRKSADGKVTSVLWSPKSLGLGERSELVFSLNEIFSKGLHIFRELSPTFKRVSLGRVRVQRQTPCKPPRSPVGKHPSLLQDNLDTELGRGTARSRPLPVPKHALRPLQLAPGGQEELGRLYPQLKDQQR